LSIYFEELAAARADEQRRMDRDATNNNSAGFTVDLTLEDDDD
jgi:hypothetical protein